MSANYINHVAYVVDASTSMDHLTEEVIKVADAQTAYLAERSKVLKQETRVSVYTFSNSNRIQCVIFDMDVLRLPSIAKHYRPSGMTALIDATLKSQRDLATTSQIYGDHAFLTFILTDGQENDSLARPRELELHLEKMKDNWTVAVLVPHQTAKFEAKKFGFPADNIAIWDATSAKGVVEAGETMRLATDTFMDGRASGIRGSRSLFATGGVDTLNSKTVKEAKLKALATGTYRLLDVDEAAPIKPYVISKLGEYRLGMAYYQLTKTETIQPQKNVAVLNKRTGKIYTGSQARSLLGLSPTENDRVKPDHNPAFDVFVQSTSVNRNLVPKTKLLIIN